MALDAIVAAQHLVLKSCQLAAGKAFKITLVLAALLRDLPQIDAGEIDAQALHELGHVHLAQIDAKRAQEVALIGREQGLQRFGIDELVDAREVGVFQRRTELLAVAAAEALQLAQTFSLQLQEALVGRRTVALPRQGCAKWRWQQLRRLKIARWRGLGK